MRGSSPERTPDRESGHTLIARAGALRARPRGVTMPVETQSRPLGQGNAVRIRQARHDQAMLDWAIFARLPGAADRNFEIVTRAAVKNAFERYGRLLGTRQQPGVEYYLRVEEPDCPLGDPPRVFGWQCRYYGDEGYLNKTRRTNVTKAIKTATKHVDGLTDFVLWTRKALSKTDVDWLTEEGDGLGVKCHGWHQDDLEGLMIGDAASLRERFFGDLVVTEQQLRSRYEEVVELVSDRYEPALHLPRVGDRELAGVLISPVALAAEAQRHASTARLQSALETLRANAADLPATPAELEALDDAVNAQIKLLDEAAGFVRAAQVDDLGATIDHLLEDESAARLLDKLRRDSEGEPRSAIDVVAESFVATNNALFRLATDLSTRLVAVRGVAGVGKTHLAADLAKPTDDRPAGVFVLARQFGQRFTDQRLAAELVPGQTDLDLALDGLQDAAARKGCRLPIVIDGLSESDRPADWRDVLTRLKKKLSECPMLALIVTVRPDYVSRCLPDGAADRTLFPFTRTETRAAVRRYFAFFKIDAGAAALPWLELSNPLLLRIFCRAVNPGREAPVAVSQIPTGLAKVFEMFLVNSIRRVAEARRVGSFRGSRRAAALGRRAVAAERACSASTRGQAVTGRRPDGVGRRADERAVVRGGSATGAASARQCRRNDHIRVRRTRGPYDRRRSHRRRRP